MGGPTKGFRVDPDRLADVADRVQRLHDAVALDHGRSGNLTDFQDSAKADSLMSALKSFWTGDDVFANAYGEEHKGVTTTFQQMKTQLENLERICRSTAQQYHGHDQQAKHDVTTSDNTAI